MLAHFLLFMADTCKVHSPLKLYRSLKYSLTFLQTFLWEEKVEKNKRRRKAWCLYMLKLMRSKSHRVQHKDNRGHSVRAYTLPAKKPQSSVTHSKLCSKCCFAPPPPNVSLSSRVWTESKLQSYDYGESTSFTPVCLLQTTPRIGGRGGGEERETQESVFLK